MRTCEASSSWPTDPAERRAYLDEKLRRERVEQGLPPEPPVELLEKIGRELGPSLIAAKKRRQEQ